MSNDSATSEQGMPNRRTKPESAAAIAGGPSAVTLTSGGGAGDTRPAASNEETPSAVSAAWLKDHVRDANVRVVDVRWALTAPGTTAKAAGRVAYDADHVPGAVFVDLDTELAASSGPGRHPLPKAEQLAAVFGKAGVGPETHVVAYDDAGGSIAARVWFLLKRAGHVRVSILDGGYKAWRAAGGETTAKLPSFAARELTLREPEAVDVVDKRAMRILVGRDDVRVIDVRAPERYRGETEPVDPRPGHVPSAKNVPWAQNLVADADGVLRLRSPSELRALYTSTGVERAKEVVFYCGSSVTACLGLLAYERAGFRGARLYEGSWSDWSRDTTLPAARGEE